MKTRRMCPGGGGGHPKNVLVNKSQNAMQPEWSCIKDRPYKVYIFLKLLATGNVNKRTHGNVIPL